MTPVLIYCYDAYCGWCYGFSPVIKRVADEFSSAVEIEVLSGGMILPPKPVPLSKIAPAIAQTYKVVEAATGVKFGQDYLWHINNAAESDWYPNSETPAIAMCIFKEIYPQRAVEFAADLQYALNFEGRDLTDYEAYRHLLEKYSIHPELFYMRLKDEEYKEQAYYEFSLIKQLNVTGFPTVFLQTGESRFVMIASGYTLYEDLVKRLEPLLP